MTMDPPIDILLVEDNPGDARLVEEALRESGVAYRLHHVSDGVAAVDYLFACGPHGPNPEPHVVLLDLNLPKLSGREVLSRVKDDETLTHIPIIALTTSQSQQDVAECYDLGANAYLIKPVDLDSFLATIDRLVTFWFRIATLPSHAGAPVWKPKPA